MNGLCKDGNEIIIAAKDLQKLADLLDEWLNGDESTFVMLGGKDTPSIRNLVAMIDERESQAALQAIDGGLQQIVLARNQVIEMRNEIRRMFTQMEGIHLLRRIGIPSIESWRSVFLKASLEQ